MLRKAWALVVFALAGVAAPAYGQTKLEWKFKPGDQFWIDDSTTIKQKVSVMGKDIEQTTKIKMVTSIKTEKVEGKTVTLTQKIEDVKVMAQGGFGGGMEQFLEKLKGATFKVTLKDSKITKFEGFDEFVKNLAGDNEEAGKLLKGMLTEESVKQMSGAAFDLFPTEPVRMGETWKRDDSMSLGPLGGFKGVNEFTYDGKDKDKVEKVTFKGTMTYQPPRGDAVLGGLLKISKGNLKSDGVRGAIYFDAEKGRLVRSNKSWTMRGSLTVDFMGQALEMDMTSEQTLNSRVLDRNPLKEQ